MPAPTTSNDFLELTRKSDVVDMTRLAMYTDKLLATAQLPTDPVKLAELLVRDCLLTSFQAEQLLQGKWKRFTIGKYKVLERLGIGGASSVYLCEHVLMRRLVAVKVLPTSLSGDGSARERFYREARVVAALDHPNIVRAYDIDEENGLHFLVMEHVDGAGLDQIVKKRGRLDVSRAAHYCQQAALGLQHAHDAAGIVHRDIKPGNLLIDRNSLVKIIDMGLARFFHDEVDNITTKYSENALGTADYLAPEQALDSHSVDIRADIYSLGCTFYFCLTGRAPFHEGTVAQKLIWHQTRKPNPIRDLRPEVPEGLISIIDRMMAKDVGLRYQTPIEVAAALIPWTQSPILSPAEDEMPQFSPATRQKVNSQTASIEAYRYHQTMGQVISTLAFGEAAGRATRVLPTEAYDGDDPCIFLSYSHKDCARVYPEIARLSRLGYRIWYDEGINPGTEWTEQVASALQQSSFFLVFISPNACASHHVRNEINMALAEEKPFLAIHLEQTSLTAGLKLQIGSLQAILKYEIPEDQYNRLLAKSLPDAVLQPAGNGR